MGKLFAGAPVVLSDTASGLIERKPRVCGAGFPDMRQPKVCSIPSIRTRGADLFPSTTTASKILALPMKRATRTSVGS
jgi:hypothetical protein